jgi:hypothetical protein
MKIEHWTYAGEHLCFRVEDVTTFQFLAVDPAVKCCEIEGEDWVDCMQKYHEHMGWAPYVPMSEDS